MSSMNADPCARRRGPRAAAWTLAALCAGCATNPIDVEAQDDAATVPSLRAVYEISAPTEREDMGGTEFGSAVELELARTEGDDTQSFGPGERIEFGELDETGPGTAAVDAELAFASLCFRGDFRLHPRVDLQALGGLAWQRVDTTVRVGAATGHDRDTSLGFKFGGRVAFHAMEDLDLRLGLGQVIALRDSDAVSLRDVQLDAQVQATKNLSLFGGWRWLGYAQERHDESDLELDFSGPTFGLQLRF